MPKQRSPDDVHDIWNVEIGKPYRGEIVEKIDIETNNNRPDGKVKIRRLIYLQNQHIIIEDTIHEYGDVYVNGELLPYDQIQFPSGDPADFAYPKGGKGPSKDDDDDEKKKKRELLRQKAKDMLNKKPDDNLRIKVKTPDGRIFPVVVKPDETVDDLKDKIEDDSDIPADEQNLTLKGKPLKKPTATMSDCGVRSGDIIEMEPKPMTIVVKTPEGEELPVSVTPSDSVRDVKKKVENKHGIPSDDQNLSFKGRPLNDPSSTLKDCGIEDGDILDLEPNDTPLTIRVRTPDGKKLRVDTKPTDTVQDLKEKIEQDHGIPVEDQNLSHHGKPLDDLDSTMKDNGIKHGDVLDLEPNEFMVHVRTPKGKRLSVNVKADDTVQELKERVEEDHGIPVEDQSLNYRGKPLDDQDSTMKDNGIKHGDVLDLEPNEFTVHVRTPKGKRLSVNVKPDDTVQELKERVEEDHGIPVEDQSLNYCGKPLDDPDSTMQGNGIKNGDTIDMKPTDMIVNVRKPDGKTLSIPVKPDDTVRNAKKTIESKHGIPVKNQKLSYEGKPLDDPSATMKDLGVADGDTLDLNPNNTADTTNRKRPTNAYGDDTYGKARPRQLGQGSAWVFPTVASAPKKGEINNLQGVWSTPPGKEAGTEPVEVNVHPIHKEPKADGKKVIHGAYGYVNGAKPDADGVVDPANILFYPPGDKNYRPDFEQVGWWSAEDASSETHVSWKFVGDDVVNVRTRTVRVMGHEMTFVNEWTENY